MWKSTLTTHDKTAEAYSLLMFFVEMCLPIFKVSKADLASRTFRPIARKGARLIPFSMDFVAMPYKSIEVV